MSFFSEEIIKSRNWMLSIGIVLGVAIGVLSWQGKDSLAMAAEPPNALTDLLRGKPPDEIYETLRKQHCLSPAGIEQRAQVMAVIAKADKEVRQHQEQKILGATREYEIVGALMSGGYLNARAGELLNTITYKPQPNPGPPLPPVVPKQEQTEQPVHGRNPWVALVAVAGALSVLAVFGFLVVKRRRRAKIAP